MTPLVTENARAALTAGGFLAQGFLVARADTAAPAGLLVLFGALSLAVAIWRRGAWPLVACSASLGGLGMAVGSVLDGGHCAPGTLLSWTGGLMVAGCAAACALEPLPSAAKAMLVAHHATAVAGMLAGMHLPLMLGRPGPESSPWELHLAMLGGMAIGGWLALTAAKALLRTRRAAWHPGTG